METAITARDFGDYAEDVQEFNGEYILPIGSNYEIHPAATPGHWAVVNHVTGEVVATYGGIDDAVAHAKVIAD